MFFDFLKILLEIINITLKVIEIIQTTKKVYSKRIHDKRAEIKKKKKLSARDKPQRIALSNLEANR